MSKILIGKDNSKDSNKPSNDDEFSPTLWVGDFTEEKAISFHDSVLEAFQKDPSKPIIINISSYGGDVDALFSMLDTMDAIRAVAPPSFKFLTVAKGKAISAGAVLLSYGDIRFAEKNSRIMIHQVVGGVFGSQPANKIEFEEIERMNDRLLAVLKKRCKMPISTKELKELLNHNKYMTPKDALDIGLIDVIGYPNLLESTYYEIRVLNGELPKEAKDANRRANKKPAKNKSKN